MVSVTDLKLYVETKRDVKKIQGGTLLRLSSGVGGRRAAPCRRHLLAPENESEKADEELSREVVVTDTPIGLQVTTVMTYHKELPPLTRLLRHLTAYFSAGSSPPPSEN